MPLSQHRDALYRLFPVKGLTSSPSANHDHTQTLPRDNGASTSFTHSEIVAWHTLLDEILPRKPVKLLDLPQELLTHIVVQVSYL